MFFGFRSVTKTAPRVSLRGGVDKHHEPLTPEQNARVDSALNPRLDKTETLTSMANEDITRDTMIKRGAPNQWMNDELINMYYMLLAARNVIEVAMGLAVPRIYVFSSFFYDKLMTVEKNKEPKYDFSAVSRWTLKGRGAQAVDTDIFQFDRLFFPVNKGSNHWMLVVVFVRSKLVQAVDSFRSMGNVAFEDNVLHYLNDKWAQLHPGMPFGTWTTGAPASTLPNGDGVPLSAVPRQTNGYDCGVFTCMFGDYLSENLPLTFTQQDIGFFRRRILSCLLERRIPITVVTGEGGKREQLQSAEEEPFAPAVIELDSDVEDSDVEQELPWKRSRAATLASIVSSGASSASTEMKSLFASTANAILAYAQPDVKAAQGVKAIDIDETDVVKETIDLTGDEGGGARAMDLT